MPFHVTPRLVALTPVLVLMAGSLAATASERTVQADLPGQLQPLASELQSERASVRTTAAFRLAEAAPRFPRLQPLLIDTLGDHEIVPQWQHPDQPWVHRVTSPGREAARGLVRLEATEALLDVLGSGSREARQNAAWALAELGEQRAVPIMLHRDLEPWIHPGAGQARRPASRRAVDCTARRQPRRSQRRWRCARWAASPSRS